MKIKFKPAPHLFQGAPRIYPGVIHVHNIEPPKVLERGEVIIPLRDVAKMARRTLLLCGED